MPFTRTCLGTREVKIQHQDGSENGVGFLATFRRGSLLTVFLATNQTTHETEIDPVVDTKIVYQVQEDKLQRLAHYLIQTDNVEGVSLECTSINASTTSATDHNDIKAVLRQHLSNGLVKMLWNGLLQPCSENTTLLLRLGTSLQQEQDHQAQLERENQQLQHDLQRWKDTANKLEGVWQSQQDSLVENFFALYQETHEELRNAKLQLQQLENRLQVVGSSPAAHHKQPHTTAAVTRLQDHPNDQDVVLYNDALVDRLAAGPSGPSTRAVQPDDNKRSHDKEESADSPLVAPPQPRRMLVGRTIAVQSVQDLFQDPVMSSRQGTNDKADEEYNAMQASRKRTSTSSSRNSNNEPAPKASKLSDQRRQTLSEMNAILRAKLGESSDEED